MDPLAPGRMRLAIDVPILAGLLLCWLVLKSFGLGPAVSDENIYFYDAWLMSQGELPYRDFFFAHPPLGLIPGWLVFALLGEFDATALKGLPVAASALSGALVYVVTRRVGGTIGAVVAACLFLFSYDLLRASSHWTGINTSVAWLTLGMAAGLRGRGVLAGGALALGVCTGVYVAPAALSLLGCLLLANTRDGVRALASSAVVWLAINSGGPGRQGHGAAKSLAGREQLKMKHRVLLDAGGEVGRRYGATRTPELFVIAPSGALVYRGAIDNSPDAEGESPVGGVLVNHVDQALCDLAAGKPIRTPQTKPYGCTVKYSR